MGVCSTVEVFSTMGGIMMHVGDILSTMGDVQYCGEYDDKCGGYLKYHGARCVQYCGGYHECHGSYLEYCGGYSVLWGYHDACGGYHDYYGECSVSQGIPSFVI